MILRYTDSAQMYMNCTFLSNNNFSLAQVVEIYAGLFNGLENTYTPKNEFLFNN